MNITLKFRPRACAHICAAAAISAGLAAAPAKAADWMDTMMDWNPYVGTDFNITSVNYEDVNLGGFNVNGDNFADDTFYGFDLHGGFTPHENFGVETGFFYNFSGEKKANIAGRPYKSEISSWGMTLDGMGYYAPLNNGNKNFKLIGTGGVTLSFVESEATIANLTSKEDDTALGFRLGGGMQFGMTENTNARVLIRHWWPGMDNVDGAWLYSFGVNYEF